LKSMSILISLYFTSAVDKINKLDVNNLVICVGINYYFFILARIAYTQFRKLSTTDLLFLYTNKTFV